MCGDKCSFWCPSGTWGPHPWQGCRVAVWFSFMPWSMHRWLTLELRIWKKKSFYDKLDWNWHIFCTISLYSQTLSRSKFKCGFSIISITHLNPSTSSECSSCLICMYNSPPPGFIPFTYILLCPTASVTNFKSTSLSLCGASPFADSPHRRTACRCTSSSPGKHCRGTTQSFYTADSSSVQPSERCLHNQYHGSTRANESLGRGSLCFTEDFFSPCMNIKNGVYNF